MSNHRILRLLGATTAVVLGGLAPGATAQTVVSLDSRAAYLHVNSDNAPAATPIALGPLGATPGTCLRLRAVGDYDPGPGGDTVTITFGVFSASTTLLGGGTLHRVVDAVDAGVDVFSNPTFIGGQATDIDEDFGIAFDGNPGEITVKVPAGAAYLFVTAGDHYFTDNTDPDGDYGVELTVVGCWTNLGSGLAGSNGMPVLAGIGTLIGGQPASLELTNANTNASAALILGFDLLGAPFKGGLIVPCVDVLITGLPTGPSGALSIPTTWPVGVPSGVSVYLQMWMLDPSSPHGASASNGLAATTP